MSGLALKTLGVKIVTPPENPAASDFCACDFWCEWEETVFANPSSSDSWKRDHSDFLFRKITSSDTLEIKLYRYGVEVATITDSTYGTYYSNFTTQPLYVGWVADWSLIFSAFSGGQYQVKASGTLAGSAFNFESRKFRLQLWNEECADGTVRIESYQDGNIMSSPFDFTGLITGGWYSAIRLNGRFGNKTPTLEVDEVLNTKYESIQNRSQVTFEYELDTKYIPSTILSGIAEKDMLGNGILLTDYSLMSGSKYIRIPVVASSFEVTHNDAYNGTSQYRILFTDRTPNTIKRNF